MNCSLISVHEFDFVRLGILFVLWFYFMVDGKEAHIPATLRTSDKRKNIDKAAMNFEK